MMFNKVDYEALIYLEGLNLSYCEMLSYFSIKVTEKFLWKKMMEFGIHHKTIQEALYENVKNSKLSIEGMSRKFKCSKRTICRIIKKIKEDYMTKITIKETNRKVTIEATGHSNYNVRGKDIVCSSISTALYYTNYFLKENGSLLSRDIKDGYFKIEARLNKTTKKIINTFKYIIQDLEEQFKNNVKLVEENE